jgi:hypothetical protein
VAALQARVSAVVLVQGSWEVQAGGWTYEECLARGKVQWQVQWQVQWKVHWQVQWQLQREVQWHVQWQVQWLVPWQVQWLVLVQVQGVPLLRALLRPWLCCEAWPFQGA